MNISRKKITWSFNVGLLLYCFLYGYICYLVDPSVLEPVAMDAIFALEIHKSIILAILIIPLISVVAFGALVIQEFWNRLIIRLFNLSEINYCEAFCILLFLSTLQGL